MPDPQWVEQFTRKVFSWLSQREVKTPLSFFFRVVGYITAVVISMIIWGNADLQFKAFAIGTGVLVTIAVMVAIFAWFRPKNLVYGETGHRAEMKFAFGTDQKELSVTEIATIAGTPNPTALTAGRETE